jgi:outer membrane protein assembly factor BamA
MKNQPRLPLLFVLFGLLLLGSCNTTRYVPDGSYLLSDIDYKIDNRQINKDELSSYVRQEDNLKILGFVKFHLWLYNLSKKDKAKSWFRDIGEPPVIYDEELKNKSVMQIQQFLFNKGYYQSTVTDVIDFKRKRARITYEVRTGRPYTISDISYKISDRDISTLVENNKQESLIKKGDILDVDVLDDERTRVARMLNNNGYFRFMADYIYFTIDSSLSSLEANVEMVIRNPRSSTDVNRESSHRKFLIDDYSVSVFDPSIKTNSIELKSLSDSLYYNGILFRFNTKMPIKASTISKTIEVEPGELYSKLSEERTYNNLYSIRQFKYVNIQFQENEQYRDSLFGMLNGKILLPMQGKQNYSVDIEGTHTSGNLGIAGNLNYQHRNLFRGGEIFDLTFKGATERQVRIINEQSTEFNMNELGTMAKLTVPGFILPGNEQKMRLYSMPFTTFSAAYNFQERPDYTRTIVNLSYGYQWKSNPSFSHILNVVDLNAVQIFRFDSTFYNSIQDLYIKSSYTDHIISSSIYSLVFNNQNIGKSPAYYFFRMNLESSGNTLWGLSTITSREKFIPTESLSGNDSPYYKLFNTRFAQYLKGDFEYRYGYRFDKYNLIATRAFFGIAIPYGNFNVTPFEKRYYTGGANGIRAWQVRTLGPGSYAAGPAEYPNQSADIKIEANIEYRFKFFWLLEGALFLDAGNVWAINRSDNREGAVFNFNKFYDEIAVGTGFGLRLVTNYFILRTDLGLKLRDPSLHPGQRIIPLNRSFQTSDLNLNIAIGYPF